MKIQIKSVTGKDIPVEVGISDTLSDLKQKIFESQGIDPGIQRFIFASRNLIDNEAVVVDQINAILAERPYCDSDVTANFTVWMAFRNCREGIDDSQRVESSGSVFTFESDVVEVVDVEGDSKQINRNVDVDFDDEGDREQMEPFDLSGVRLQIHVKTITGSEIPVEVVPTDTVDDLKQKIFDKEEVDPDHQRIICGDRQLASGIVFDLVYAILARQPRFADLVESDAVPGGPDTRTVHVTITMVLRLRGGGNAVFHKVQWRSSSYDSNSDEDIPKEKGVETVSDEVQVPRSLSPMPESSNGNKHLQNGGGNQIYHRPFRSGDQSSGDELPREGRNQARNGKLTRIKRLSAVSPVYKSDSDDVFDDDRSGGNQVRDQSVDRMYDSNSDDDRNGRELVPQFSSEDKLSQNGVSSSNVKLIRYPSETSFSRDRLRKFGFGSKTAHPLEGLPNTEKGSGSTEIKESEIGKVKRAIEGEESQVLFEILHSVTENIESKETNALYAEGIDQIIQGMYSLELFRSRMESEKHMVSSEQTPQMEQLIRMVSVTQFALDRSNKEILELREERSKMRAEISNLKKLAKDAGNQGYDRGYERAVKDIEGCIANEHPEWDLSFIQS